MADATIQMKVVSMNTHNRKFYDKYLEAVLKYAIYLHFSLDNKSAGRQSVSSAKPGLESDTDSMAEYGDGDTGRFPWQNFLKFLKNI